MPTLAASCHWHPPIKLYLYRPFQYAVILACAMLGCLGCNSKHGAELRVATLNLYHGRGPVAGEGGIAPEKFHGNLDAIAEVLRREGPDVVGLQEADDASSWSGRFDHVAYLAEQSEYAHRFLGAHVDVRRFGLSLRYGTAPLSNRPLAHADSHAFRVEPLDTKGYVSAGIDFDGGNIVIVSVHLDFKSATYRKRQAKVLVDRLGRRDGPMVILGDFNSVWEDSNDALRLIAEGLNLQSYRPDGSSLATWPSNRPTRRIDWILISRELEFVDYRCWPDPVSDHLGVAATLRRR